MIDTIEMKELAPAVLVLQADGGPDRSIKRVQVRLALVAAFKYLDLDHLLATRCAPNGSARDIVERAMSPINCGLLNVATKRKVMSQWAEDAVANCTSMADIRKVAERTKKLAEEASTRIAQLNESANLRSVRRLMQRKFCGVENGLAIVETIMAMLGARVDFWADSEDGQGGVSGLMEMGDGVTHAHSTVLPESVKSAKREAAVKWASRDFMSEWNESIAAPLGNISDRLGQLKVSDRPVVVTERVDGTIEKKLQNVLLEMDPNYKEDITKAEDMTKVLTVLDRWMKRHAVITPYSISIQKCNDRECCPPLRTPAELCSIAMQRQPTPREDPSRPGHFLERDNALVLHGEDSSSLTNLSDLPSANDKNKEVVERRREKAERDLKTSQRLKMRSWEPKKLKGYVWFVSTVASLGCTSRGKTTQNMRKLQRFCIKKWRKLTSVTRAAT